jgi:hypothetical protein
LISFFISSLASSWPVVDQLFDLSLHPSFEPCSLFPLFLTQLTYFLNYFLAALLTTFHSLPCFRPLFDRGSPLFHPNHSPAASLGPRTAFLSCFPALLPYRINPLGMLGKSSAGCGLAAVKSG